MFSLLTTVDSDTDSIVLIVSILGDKQAGQRLTTEQSPQRGLFNMIKRDAQEKTIGQTQGTVEPCLTADAAESFLHIADTKVLQDGLYSIQALEQNSTSTTSNT